MQSRPSLLLAVLAVAACGTSSQQAVDIDQIMPTSATSLDPVPVQIDGAFALDITNDLDDGTLGVASFDVLIDDTPLLDVVWQSESQITATIPAGLPPGLHDVVVVIGTRRGVLADGFAITGAELTATLAADSIVGRGAPLTVTMTVTNTGISAATMVAPSELTTSGTATATLTTPAAGGASVGAGASTTFEWTYTAQGIGMIAFSGNATALDELTTIPIASPVVMSNAANVVEVTTIVDNPLGDGSPFGFVAGYQGHVYIGPSATGTSVARLLPDGTNLEANLGFTFARDTTGNTTASTAPAYTSIGYTGCTPNATCGPDNEDGRGLFTAGTLGGSEWLVVGGARSGGDLDYLYMTSDTDTTLDFRYVDLSAYLGPATDAVAAAHFHGDRLYLSFVDSGGSRPYLLALQVAPPAPGLDAAGTTVIDLTGSAFPGLNTPNPSLIDSFGDLNGLLYVAHARGIYAARKADPGPYSTADWASATPAFTQWSSKTSVATTKDSDLLPADRAIPQIASFGGRLFFGRNTTAGPQLWACNPAGSASPTRCEPGDWQLAAPNLLGDNQLTQFNNPALTSISMVVATSQYLYVGFDSATGVRVFRTSNPASLLPIDFEGFMGCTANNHPTCEGIGGAGLGDPADTQILDAKALTFDGKSAVWITVGDATGAIRLVMIP